jgi:Stress responsive A/B Barrel Domain
MIRHVALFTWTEDMTQEMEEPLESELNTLALTLPGVQAYRAGADVGIVEGNFDFAVVADFDDADSYLAYRTNAQHQDIIGRLSGPPTRARASVQYKI